MSYAPPVITAAGLSIPAYEDIRDSLIQTYKSIYGQSASVQIDDADYQWISAVALMLSDEAQALQLIYNQSSPATASGAALDELVKLNGIQRKVASASTCQVTITGTPGTVINNGIVRDVVYGLNWNLAASLTIGLGGTVNATAVCSQVGAFNITAFNQITGIVTPQSGWVSVNNGSFVAVVGQPVETDAQLRARQALSVELPSSTTLQGTIAAIAAVSGVARYNVEENATGATDANGCPAHSITAVVEGGTDVAVATAIYNNRGLGVLTNGPLPAGSTAVSVGIPDPNTGIVTTIGFQRPQNKAVYVVVNAHPVAGGVLSGAQVANLTAALVSYLNSLQIGEVVSYGALVAAAMSVNINLSQPSISVRSLFMGLAPAPSTITDLAIAFNQVAQGITGNITVVSV